MAGLSTRTTQLPDYITKVFPALAEKAGLKRIRFHDLRHSFATVAFAADVPLKAVSEILGHASVKITGDIYTEALEQKAHDAVAQVARAMGEGAAAEG